MDGPYRNRTRYTSSIPDPPHDSLTDRSTTHRRGFLILREQNYDYDCWIYYKSSCVIRQLKERYPSLWSIPINVLTTSSQFNTNLRTHIFFCNNKILDPENKILRNYRGTIYGSFSPIFGQKFLLYTWVKRYKYPNIFEGVI